jgi:hypothetical protein
MIRGMNPRQSHRTDLSDQARDLIKHLVPEATSGWPPEASPKRDILDGVFSLLRSGSLGAGCRMTCRPGGSSITTVDNGARTGPDR